MKDDILECRATRPVVR